MGLETGNFPSDLVASNPLGSDDKSQGDDHIRLIKNVIKQTLPNIDGAITATQDEINAITNTELFFQPGMIIMWSGSVASLPSGWAICDGTSGTPNLVGRFIVGSATDVGGTFDVGDTGGVDSNSHAHSGSVAGHTLTVGQIPSHRHNSLTGSDSNTVVVNSNGKRFAASLGADPIIETTNIQATGGGGSHNHGLTINTTVLDNKPPYFALAFIMKI